MVWKGGGDETAGGECWGFPMVSYIDLLVMYKPIWYLLPIFEIM